MRIAIELVREVDEGSVVISIPLATSDGARVTSNELAVAIRDAANELGIPLYEVSRAFQSHAARCAMTRTPVMQRLMDEWGN